MGQRRAKDAVVASILRLSRGGAHAAAAAAVAAAATTTTTTTTTTTATASPARRSVWDASSSPALRWLGASRAARSRILRHECARALSQAAKREGPRPNIAIVGGGLTGLTAAYYLARELPAGARLTLLEGGERLGGWIRTDRVNVDVAGFRGVVSFERGPRTLSSLSRSTWRFDDLVLYDLAVNLGLKLEMPLDRPRHIYYPDRLVPLPPATSLARFVQEPLFLESVLPALGFLLRRLRRDRPAPAEDLSVAEWVRSITGSYTLADNVVSAMLHGIYGGDVDALSARSVLEPMYWAYYLPRLGDGAGGPAKAMPLHEQALMARMAQDPEVRRLALKPKGSLLHFGAAGMESLPLALADALKGQHNVDVWLNEPVKHISRRPDGALEVTSLRQGSHRHTEAFDKVIATVPAPALAKMTGIAPLARLDAVSIMTVNLWYPDPRIKPPGVGYLIPRSVPRALNPERALGVFFDSDVGLAGPPAGEPPGTKLFVLMGGHYYAEPGAPPPPSPDQAVEQAKALLERHLGIPRDAPCFATARLARDCIPQHRVGHQDTLAEVAAELHEHFDGSLAVAGGSYAKIGAMGAMRAGYDIAREVLDEIPESCYVSTGLDWLENVGESVVVPVSEIPVRRFAMQK
ncbi:Protoporphyrinogen oxidase [Escovopsis weberi]|uniref:Protoporphyrinogen oxidase n=1 Tax=Escovopsis weberi TaxID=150374 RepID=A0A0M8MX50_ESCWE|nr:Protoporphyrinogen oxidase [Escovopsis weberi]